MNIQEQLKIQNELATECRKQKAKYKLEKNRAEKKRAKDIIIMNSQKKSQELNEAIIF